MVEFLTFSFGSFRVTSVARMTVEEFCDKHKDSGIDIELLEDIWQKCQALTKQEGAE